MIDLDKYRKYEALGKAKLLQKANGVIEVVIETFDEIGNLTPTSLGQIIISEAQEEVAKHEAIVTDWKSFIYSAFGESALPVKGMSRLDFLWGRFYKHEVIGSYTLALTNGTVAAFIDAIRMSTPDDFNRYVVLQHPLVLSGVPEVMAILEQAGIIPEGTAATRAAEVLNPDWVKP